LPAVFGALSASGIEYAVLRNYEGLPYAKPGNDIDLIIHPGARSAALDVLGRAADACGWSTIQRLDRPYAAIIKFADGRGTPGRPPDVLHLDLFTVGSWYGATFLDARSALARRRAHGPAAIPVVDPVDEGVHLLAHHFLWTGFLRKESYRALVGRLLSTHERQLTERLRALFGATWTGRLLRATTHAERLGRRAHLALRVRFLAGRGLGTLSPDGPLWWGMLRGELRQAMSPPGALVGLRAGEHGLAAADLDIFASWVRRVGQFNHVFVDEQMKRVVESGEPVIDERVRRAHAGAWGHPARLRRRLRRVVRRGSIVIYPLTGQTGWLMRDTDIVLRPGHGGVDDEEGGGDVVVSEYRSIEADGCRALVAGLAAKCTRVWSAS
jgi:hypothetical protein